MKSQPQQCHAARSDSESPSALVFLLVLLPVVLLAAPGLAQSAGSSARSDQSEHWSRLVRDADAARGVGRCGEAILGYREALLLRVDAAVRLRLAACLATPPVVRPSSPALVSPPIASGPSAPVTAPEPAPANLVGRRRYGLPVTLLVGTAAALSGGRVFAVAEGNYRREAARHEDDSAEAHARLMRTADAFGTLSTALWVTGGVAGAATIVAFAIPRRRASPQVALTPAWRGHAGAMLHARW